MGYSESRRRIVEYLKRNLKKGYSLDTLKYALLSQGYSKPVVDIAIQQVHHELSKEVPVLKDKPKIAYEVIDENDNPVEVKKPWWKRFFD